MKIIKILLLLLIVALLFAFVALGSKDILTYTITFDTGIEDEPPYSETAAFNSVLTLPVPSREGYSFKGWQSDGKPFINNRMPARNILLSAVWELRPDYFEVTFDMCLEESQPIVVPFLQGSPIVAPQLPQRLGYKVSGWQKDNQPYILGNMPQENIVLSAQWDYDFIENVPAVIINTDNGMPIVSKEDYIDSMIAVMNAPDSEHNFDFKLAQIRGRGNSSWGLEKKPYRIKFDKKTKMFGSEYKAKSWTLIANHSDKTLIRNKLAYDFSRSLDTLIYSPMAQIVELYLNGVYQGVYMFCDHNQVNEGRVDLPEADGEETSLDDVGFFVEFNIATRLSPDGEGHEFFRISEGSNLVFEIKSPDPDDFSDMSSYIDYIKQITINAHEAIMSKDFNTFNSLIDVPSFIDYFLIEELFKNTDVGCLSVHFYKKPHDIKLYMGPVWDFDISAGNANYINYAPQGLWAQTQNMWFAALMDNETFFNMYKARWNELYSAKIRELLDSIVPLSLEYNTAFLRNFERWDIMGSYVWPNPDEVVALATYREQVEYLHNYLLQRADWLDTLYNS